MSVCLSLLLSLIDCQPLSPDRADCLARQENGGSSSNNQSEGASEKERGGRKEEKEEKAQQLLLQQWQLLPQQSCLDHHADTLNHLERAGAKKSWLTREHFSCHCHNRSSSISLPVCRLFAASAADAAETKTSKR